MTIAKGSLRRRESCCFTLAVNRYDDQDMECIVYVGNQKQGTCCRSFTSLARSVERGIEEMNYPTPSVKRRRFSAGYTVKAGEEQEKEPVIPGRKSGSLGTFRLRVKQCLNATWQGQVEHEGQAVSFESFLELINIIDRVFLGSQPFAQEEESLAASLAQPLSLVGRYSGIWVKERGISEVLSCGRELADGSRETFAIRPMFRQNHTFQGTLYWGEGRQQKNFRSFMELLSLIMSAAGRREAKDEE